MTTNPMSNPGGEANKEAYSEVMQMLRYEGTMLWQRFSAFLVAHTLFAALLGHAALDATPHPLFVTFGALVGLLLSAAWFCTFARGSEFFDLRIAQAHRFEPADWKIIRDVGERFSKGEKVLVGSTEKQMRPLARKFRMRTLVYVCMAFITLLYVALAIVSFLPKR